MVPLLIINRKLTSYVFCIVIYKQTPDFPQGQEKKIELSKEDFQELGQLGEGAGGQVFKAIYKPENTTMALKV